MADSATQPNQTQPAPPRRSVPEPVILRDWPKIIMMWPTLVAGLVCGIIMALWGTTPPDHFARIHYVGLVFLVILAINMTLLLYDLSLRGFIIVALAILALVLAIFLLNQQFGHRVWKGIARALSIQVWANAAFYFTFSLVLLLNLAIAWITTRFNYWKVENNEIIIHEGFMHEQERHPTAQARFRMVVEDIVEYGLLGSGKLVFYFGDAQTEKELKTVLFVHRKAKALDELLGRVAVVQK